MTVTEVYNLFYQILKIMIRQALTGSAIGLHFVLPRHLRVTLFVYSQCLAKGHIQAVFKISLVYPHLKIEIIGQRSTVQFKTHIITVLLTKPLDKCIHNTAL